MVCPKCGAEVEVGALFCPSCGAAVMPLTENTVPQAATDDPTEVLTEETPAEEAAQTPVAECAEAPTEEAATEPAEFAAPDFSDAKSQKKKKPFILLAAGVIVLALIVAVALNLRTLYGSMIRSFGSDIQYFEYVEAEALHGYSEDIAEFYGSILADSQIKTHASRSTVKPYISPEALNLIKSAGVEEDLSWLNDLEISALFQIDNALQSINYGVSIADQHILSYRMLTDLATRGTYYFLPEATDKVIYTPGFDSYLYEEDFSETMSQFSQLRDALPSEDQLNKLLVKYMDIALKSIDTVSKSQDTLTVDGISQKCTVLRLNVTKKTVCDISEAVLKAAKADKELKTILDNLQKKLEELNPDKDIPQLYAEFLDAVEEALEDIEDARDEITDDETLFTLRDYVDSKHRIIGRKITAQGETILFYAQAEDGKRYATQFEVEMLALSGSGTVNGGKKSGDYKLTVAGLEILKLTVENQDLSRASKGVFSGTYRLAPGKYLLTMLSQDDAAASVLSLLDPVLEFKVESAKETATVELNLLNGQERFAGITASGSLTEMESLTVPTENLLDISTRDGFDQLTESLHVDQILENLQKANLPESMQKGISESIIDMITDYFHDIMFYLNITANNGLYITANNG